MLFLHRSAVRSAAAIAFLLQVAPARAATPESAWKELKADALMGLPLIENLPPARQSNVCVVFFSGDGGWADIDQTITGELLKVGLPVVGVDSLSWFLLGRSPGRSGRDLLRIMTFYHHALQTDRFILAGFSRGADALPFMVRRLPAEARRWVRLMALLAPERDTDFQTILIHALRGGPPAWCLRPVRGELDLLRDVRTIGFYGAGEAATSLCTQAPEDFKTIYVMAGGHHFDGGVTNHEPYVRIAGALTTEISGALAAP